MGMILLRPFVAIFGTVCRIKRTFSYSGIGEMTVEDVTCDTFDTVSSISKVDFFDGRNPA